MSGTSRPSASSTWPARPRPGRPGGCTASRTCPRVRPPRRPWPTWRPTGSTRGWPAWPRTAEASYTRYADDLVFSGGEAFARSIGRFPTHVAAIALEEGFAVQHRKTRVMRQGVSQRAAGVVINQKINMTRDDYDRLKAILCNCVRHGPQGQNRAGVADFRAHLAGRVAHAARLNPERGRRLTRLFEQIAW